MTFYAFLAVGFGAAIGAWLRWGFGLWFNPVLPELPLGTLAANLVGGYLVGLAIAFFLQHPALSLEWRLFLSLPCRHSTTRTGAKPPPGVRKLVVCP